MQQTVLVIHERASVRGLLGMRLALAGFHAVGAADEESGVHAVAEFKPVCVIVDLVSQADRAVSLTRILHAQSESQFEVMAVVSDGALQGMERLQPVSKGQLFHPSFADALASRFLSRPSMQSDEDSNLNSEPFRLRSPHFSVAKFLETYENGTSSDSGGAHYGGRHD